MLQTQSRIQENGHWIVFVAVIVFGLTIAFYLYSLDKYSLIYFGDSVSHMLGARKIVDWMEPGLQQVGTVWLPLPHFMLLPFTLVDSLFVSGFAGVIVSLPCLAITSALLYKMIRAHLVNGLAYVAFAGALLYAANPNILYLGLTAMTEAPFMLFFVTSAYYLQKWYKNSGHLQNLVLSSIFVSLATLCRYEGWILPLFVIPLAIVLALRDNKAGAQKKILTILLSFVSFSGIILWLVYNANQYGDPLEFADQQYYSASSQALGRDIRVTLFLQPANIMSVYGVTALLMYGPILLTAALIGYILHRRREGGKDRRMLHVFLVLPPLFTIISLLIGIGEMTFWFNSRFLILLSPLLVVLVAVFLQNQPKKIKGNRALIAAAIGALFVFQMTVPAFGAVITYLDASAGFFYKVSPSAVQTGEALKSMYDDGSIMIMTGAAQEHRIMITSSIPLRNFDEIIESSMSKPSFSAPWLYDKWMVIGKEPNPDAEEAMKYWQDRRGELEEHYSTVYENQYYEILLLK
jgi:4-amino-4-deoxy-L-arabinose transferase-like glycosyltransferase